MFSRAAWRRTARWGVCLSAIAGAALVVLILCISWRPAWYRPASIDYSRLADDRKALLDLVDEISAALNAGRSIEVRLSAEQACRWLAARHDAPFEWDRILDVLPETPLVDFEADGTIRFAGVVRALGAGSVIAVDLMPSLSEEELRFTLIRCRLGAIPIPGWGILSRIASYLPQEALYTNIIGHTIVLSNHWVWPNGRRAFEFQQIFVEDRHIICTLIPTDR